MAQGDFTREKAQIMEETFNEVFKALPEKKQIEFLGHANDIYLFLAACQRECPAETK